MIRKLIAFFCLTAAFAIALSGGRLFAQDETVKRAFLVGVAKYSKDGLPDLAYSENDMKALSEELSKQGFEVTMLLGREATHDNITSSLQQFVKELRDLSKTDVALFGFSGHGQQRQVEINGRLTEDAFFCPVDALKDKPETLISIGQLMDDVQQKSGSSQNLLLIDACRDNPAKGAKGIDGGTALNLGNKISVLYSSTNGMRSYEARKVEHGLFTYVLLEGLRGEAASRSGEISWLNLASYVMDAVPARAAELLEDPNVEQRPNLIGNLVRQPVLARLEATPEPVEEPRKAAISLAGRAATGTWENSQGQTDIMYVFRANGQAIYLGPSEIVVGKWSQEDHSIALKIGVSDEHGEIDGDELVLSTNANGKQTGVAKLRLLDPVKNDVLDLTGRSGPGKWITDKGSMEFSYRFLKNGKVLYKSAREQAYGKWTQLHDRVEVVVGASREKGELIGNWLILQTNTGNVGGGIAVVHLNAPQ